MHFSYSLKLIVKNVDTIPGIGMPIECFDFVCHGFSWSITLFARFIYVKDEPRVALVAQLANGLTIATTHLSFVPGVNIYQLNRLSAFMKKLPGEKILTGDLNLPADIPSKLSRFKSIANALTYPSWGEKIQFDYIMAEKNSLKSGLISATLIKNNHKTIISDHIPIGVELKFQ